MIEIHFESDILDRERHRNICGWLQLYSESWRAIRPGETGSHHLVIFGAEMSEEALTGFILKFNPKIVKVIPEWKPVVTEVF